VAAAAEALRRKEDEVVELREAAEAREAA